MGAQKIAEVIQESVKLETLDLSYFSIPNDGVVADTSLTYYIIIGSY